MKKISEWIEIGAKLISNVADRPRFEAEILFCHATGVNRVQIVTRSDEICDSKNYLDLINLRANYEPIEYITGKTSFYSREFLAKKGVLIARPETEILVEKSLDLIKDINAPVVAEIGTGSGVIAVMIAIIRSDAKIIATDINEVALDLALQNAQRFGVANRIRFVQTNLLDLIDEKLDLIVSNPPYIANDFELDLMVQKEPKTALFGGEKGHEILEKIITLAEEKKVANLACESGFDQKMVLENLLKATSFKSVEFYKDYSNLQRGFTAKR